MMCERAYLDYNKEKVKGHLMKAGLSEEEANDHIESAYRIIKLRSLNPLVLTQKQRVNTISLFRPPHG